MFEEAVVTELREKLLAQGSANFVDNRGRRLFLIHTSLLKLNFVGVLLAYENCGAFTFDLERPLNKFRLISAGFPMDVSDDLAELVNRVTRVVANPALIAAPARASAQSKPARRARKK